MGLTSGTVVVLWERDQASLAGGGSGQVRLGNCHSGVDPQMEY